ncbi:cytochrome c family protein [Sphingomonas sp.]|jgi:cytochrome c|uniref:c-type cytochrome n=1 Tax=Sphingomonas sp. TaxID=28214 RepID=UPI003562568E
MTIIKGLTAIATSIVFASSALAAAPTDAEQKAAFAPCMACHTKDKGVNKIGPSLFGVVGRKVASVSGFSYSAGMKAKGGNWTPEQLDAYITNPRQVVPGTYMSYPGQKDPAKRAAVIAYLKTFK